jgi:hypothetical protein
MMGPQVVDQGRSTARAVEGAKLAGLEVLALQEQALRVEFLDVAAVVHFLRKVLWTVPGFTVAAYREPLLRVHRQIQADGMFVSHSQRFLVEARRPLP